MWIVLLGRDAPMHPLLSELGRPWELVRAGDVSPRLAANPPAATLLVGDELDATFLDLQRLLGYHRVPTLVVLRELPAHHWRILLDRGVWGAVTADIVPDELRHHVNQMLQASTTVTVQDGPDSFIQVHLDAVAQTIVVGTRAVPLTRTELALMQALMQRPAVVVTWATLRRVGRTSSPHAHLSHVRKKLHDADAPRLIVPVRGIGCRLVDDAGCSDVWRCGE